MKTFDQRCQAYHLALSLLNAHEGSDESHEIGSNHNRERFQLYLDLVHWPESPDLKTLNHEQTADLIQWGALFQEKLNAFHDKKQELRSELTACLLEALKTLGVESGHDFTSMPGTAASRLGVVFSGASNKRKTMLDGISYVSKYDTDKSHFLPSFLRTAKLA